MSESPFRFCFVHEPPKVGKRLSTRTVIYGIDAHFIPADKILFTNDSADNKVASPAPIVVIPFEDKYLILDGNHRAHNKIKIKGYKVVRGFILTPEIPKCKIRAMFGKSLPLWLERYKNDEITYDELLEETLESHNKLIDSEQKVLD